MRGAFVIILALSMAGCASTDDGTTPRPSTGEATTSDAATTTTDDVAVTTTTSASVASSSTSSSGTASSSQAPTPPPVKDADELVLRSWDLGSGWIDESPQPAPGTATNQTDDAKTSLSRSSGTGTPWLVETTVRVFATAADAQAEFASAKQEVPPSDRAAVAAGDEAFLWVQSPGQWEEGWVVEGRVVWYVYAAGDGGTPSPTTASLLQTCAAKQ